MRVQLAAMAVMACAWVDAQEIDQDLRLNILPTGEKTLEWQGHLGRSYFIQASPNLANWTWAPNIESGTDTSMSYEVGGAGDKGFFRLQYTDQTAADLDSADFDGDGLTNSEEITLRVRPRYLISGLPSLMQTDPLDPDTDHDLLSDAWEIANGTDPTDDGSADIDNGPLGDVDGDGVNNYRQAAGIVADTGKVDEMDQRTSHIPRYAVFQMEGFPSSPAGDVIINDRGTAISRLNYWKCGAVKPLSTNALAPTGYDASIWGSIDINDNDQIVSTGSLIGNDGQWIPSAGFIWPSPDVDPYVITTELRLTYSNNLPSEHNFPNTCSLYGYYESANQSDGHDPNMYRWKVTSEGGATKESAKNNGLIHMDKTGRLEWGYDLTTHEPILYFDGTEKTPAGSSITRYTLVKAPNRPEKIYAFGYSSGGKPVCYESKENEWKLVTFAGSTADHITGEGMAVNNTRLPGVSLYIDGIGATIYNPKKPIPIPGETISIWHLNGEFAPDLPAEWSAGSSVTMTTAHGWMLWRNSLPDPDKFAVSAPLTLRGSYTKSDGTVITEDCGVDDFSLTATDLGNNSGIQKRIWIMVPAGSDGKKILAHTPASPTAPIKIKAAGITCTPCESLDSEINITTTNTVTTEITPDIQFGTDAQNVLSVSKPIGLKVMKHRTVRVSVFRVSLKEVSSTGVEAVTLPDIGDAVSGTTEKRVSTEDIQKFLNDVYKPQLNVDFEVTDHTAPTGGNYEIAWDIQPIGTTDLADRKLEVARKVGDNFSSEQQIIRDATSGTPSNCDICLYLVSGNGLHDSSSTKHSKIAGFSTVNARDVTGYCWVSSSTLPGYDSKIQMLTCIAHEIGHRIFGGGHPNPAEGELTGPAELFGSNYNRRLMRSGGVFKPNPGTLIVKQEWDYAETWLTEIDSKNNQ